MDDHHNDKILSTMTMVWLKYGWFRGAVKLLAQDIKLGVGGKLPPEEVTRLGSKLVFDPKELTVFGTLTKRAERALLSVGVRFMGGFAIPNEHLDAVTADLRLVECEFRSALSDLTNRYNDIVNNWIAKNPDFDDAIRRSVLPVSEVEARCHFRFRLYGITVPEGLDAADTAASEVATMGDTLLDEVAVEVRDIIRDSIDGKPPRIKVTILSKIERVRRKLKALAFLDKDVKPVLEDLNAFVLGVPAKGPIEGAVYHWMVGLLSMLADPVKVRSHANALRQGTVVDFQHSLADAGVVTGATGDLLSIVPAAASSNDAADSTVLPISENEGVESKPVFVPPPAEEDEDEDANDGPSAELPPVGFVPPAAEDDEDEDGATAQVPPASVSAATVPVHTRAAVEEDADELDLNDGLADFARTDVIEIGGSMDLPDDDGDLFAELPPAPVAAQAATRAKRPLRGFNFSS